MFKKSMIIAGLLASTTFGAELPNQTAAESGNTTAVSEVRDLAWVKKEMHEAYCQGYAQKSQQRADAVRRLLEVFTVLQSNPSILAQDKSSIVDLGFNLNRFGAVDEAFRVYTHVLNLDPNEFAYSIVDACSLLVDLGHPELAINKLIELANNPSLNSAFRTTAVLRLFSDKLERFVSPAIQISVREAWVKYTVENGYYDSIENARLLAEIIFPINEELEKKAKAN